MMFNFSKSYLDNLNIFSYFWLKFIEMVVISYGTLKDFFTKHAAAKDPLNNWYRVVCKADWANFHEMKDLYGSVDAVGNDRFVFNIKGNDFRLVAMIFFDVRTVYIRFVGTHAEYDKLKDCSFI